MEQRDDAGEDLVHPDTSAPGLQKKFKFVLLSFKKNPKNIYANAYTYIIYFCKVSVKNMLYFGV